MPLRFPAPAHLPLLAVLLSGPVRAEGGSGLVVRLGVSAGAPAGPYTVLLTHDAVVDEISLNDDGQEVDSQAGDQSWTGMRWIKGDDFAVALRTGDGVVDGGKVCWPAEVRGRDLSLQLGAGTLAATPTSPPPPPDGQPPPEGVVAQAQPASPVPWILLVALAVLGGVAWVGRVVRAAWDAHLLRALEGPPRLTLPGLGALPIGDSLHTPSDGDLPALAAHLVAALATRGPVVVVGASPPSLPTGPVFRYTGEKRRLPRTLRLLAARSLVPPTVVAVVEQPTPHALEDLADALPDGIDGVFVVPAVATLEGARRHVWTRSAQGWAAA